MDLLKGDVVTQVFRLLPGFISAWIFYGWTAHPKKDAFDRVVQALIFTVIVEMFVIPLAGFFHFWGTHVGSIGTWTEQVALVWRVTFAVPVGIVASLLANTNWLRDCEGAGWVNRLPAWMRSGLPKWLSKRTTYPSEWYSAFHRTGGCYAYLTLKGERRLYGWIEEFPDSPSSGHFSVMEPAWILSDNTHAPAPTIERMLVQASEVEFVEFAKPDETLTEEQLKLNQRSVDLMLEYIKSEEAKEKD